MPVVAVTGAASGLGHALTARLAGEAAVSQASLAAKTAEPVEVSMGLAAWQPGQDWQDAYEVVDSDLYEDKRRRKEAKQLVEQESPEPKIRLLGRASGKRRAVSG